MTGFSPAQYDRLLDWICSIQQIPAQTFHESTRAAYMAGEFRRLGLADVFLDDVGNVLGRFPGADASPLVVSAHLDTVHPAGIPLSLDRTGTTIIGPGVADNSVSLAALLATVDRLINENISLPGDVWFVADVCEEGLGNLAGMKAVVDRFQDHPRAYLVIEGLGLGQVCHRGLGVIRYRVTAETAGGHAWVNYGAPSAIHELVSVMSDLAAMTVSRKPRASLNIGVIQGGTSINTIAPTASFDIDLRAETQDALLRLNDRVRNLIRGHSRAGVQITIEPIGNRPAGEIAAGHLLVRQALAVLQQLGIPAVLEVGSTDANIPLSRGYPAICIGLTRGANPHTTREMIELEPLASGMEQLWQLVNTLGLPGA